MGVWGEFLSSGLVLMLLLVFFVVRFIRVILYILGMSWGFGVFGNYIFIFLDEFFGDGS